MKVAIWGSYNFGNYGDDLMALQFGQHLLSLGLTPWVYRLDQELANRYGLNTTNSLTELLEGSKFCIIGGGGMLVGKRACSTSPNLGDSIKSNSMNEDFKELYTISLEKRCPIYPISVGGDGRGINTPLEEWNQKFWECDSCRESTVRLKEDVELVNSLGKDAIYIPDVLWTVERFWNIQASKEPNEHVHVGINLPNSRLNRFFVVLLEKLTFRQKNITFHFIRTYLPQSSKKYDILPKMKSSRVQHHTYDDPKKTLDFLATLDLVVSYKLHLGLTALALEVPFYSFEGQEKTKTLLKSINAGFAILPNRKTSQNKKSNFIIRFFDVIKLALIVSNTESIKSAKAKFDFKLINEIKHVAWEHMDKLEDIVAQHQKGANP
jgi:polysaccharide pyruvyl transferase WcaK-like protein